MIPKNRRASKVVASLARMQKNAVRHICKFDYTLENLITNLQSAQARGAI